MSVLLSIPVRDADGDIEAMNLYFDDAVTLAQVTAYYDAFVPLLDVVVGGVIGNGRVTYELTVPAAAKDDPSANIENQLGSTNSFVTTGRHNFGLRIPALSPSFIVGDSINTADPSYDAVMDAVVTGLAGIAPIDPQGPDITSLARARKSQTKK